MRHNALTLQTETQHACFQSQPIIWGFTCDTRHSLPCAPHSTANTLLLLAVVAAAPYLQSLSKENIPHADRQTADAICLTVGRGCQQMGQLLTPTHIMPTPYLGVSCTHTLCHTQQNTCCICFARTDTPLPPFEGVAKNWASNSCCCSCSRGRRCCCISCRYSCSQNCSSQLQIRARSDAVGWCCCSGGGNLRVGVSQPQANRNTVAARCAHISTGNCVTNGSTHACIMPHRAAIDA